MVLRLNQLVAALLCAVVFVESSSAEDGAEVIGDIKWSYSVTNGEATVTGLQNVKSVHYYVPVGGDVEFPETLGGCPVVALKANALYDANAFTSLKFPDSFRTIGAGNFRYTGSLTNMTFGTGLRDFQPFSRRDVFQAFTVPEGNPYFSAEGPILYSKDRKTLVMCGANLTSFDVPSHVTAIGSSAFSEMQTLESVTFPFGLLEIGDSAFSMCQNLEDVAFPTNLHVIGNGAFSSCLRLDAVSVPGTVAKIGDSAFSRCIELASLAISEGVRDIGMYAFDNCVALAAVVIPNSVTNIGGCAFLYCTNLWDVTIGSGVVKIGSGLGEPYMDDWGNTYREDAMPAFGGCESLLNFKLVSGNTVFEEIGGCLFLRATPNSAKTLAVYPNGRRDLYFTGDVNVTKIGEAACAYCPNFTTLDITNSVRDIGTQSFMNSWGLRKVVVNPGVTNIDYGAFCLNMELVDVEIAGTVKTIGEKAFMHDYMPTESTVGRLVLHEGIEEIGPYAFERTRDLAEVVIPDSVTTLGPGVFCNAMGLRRLTVGSGITELPVDFCAYDNVLTTVTFRGNVTSIGESAFMYCEALENIDLPNTVEYIGNQAFYQCYKLPYVAISAATIGAEAFRGCEKLSRIDFADDVKTICTNAFRECNRLRSVVIPASVETLEPGAFMNCSSLGKVYLPLKFKDNIDASVFQGCPLNDEDIVYYDAEGPEFVTVTFMSQGEVVDTRKYLVNMLDYLPEVSASGLAFVGWYNAQEDGEPASDADITGESVTLYARWVESPFVDQQGWLPAEDEDLPDASVWRSVDLSKSGEAFATYEVVGPASVSFLWKRSDDTSEDDFTVAIDGEIVDYTYNLDWQKKTVDVTEPGVHLVTWRYMRNQWSGDPEFANASVADIRVVPGTAKTITFDTNGGTLDEGWDATRKVVAVLGDLPMADRDGVAFAGWWTDRDGGERVTAATKPEGDATYFAHWVEMPFTVSGDGRFWLAEDGSWATLRSADGRSVTASARLKGPCMVSFEWRHVADRWSTSLFKVDGETWTWREEDKGWATVNWSADDTAEHVVEWQFSGGWSSDPGEMRIRNISMGTPYDITFDPNDGYSPTVEKRAGKLGTLPVPYRFDYVTFDGWYTAPEGGERVTGETPVTGPATYYGRWVQSPVAIYWGDLWLFEPDGSLVSDNTCDEYNPSVAEKELRGAPGTLMFRWRMQSDSGNGTFSFLTDVDENNPNFVVTNSLTRTSDGWVTERYVFTKDVNVRWSYSVGASRGGIECGWIKDVTWTPGVVDPVEWKVTFNANGGELKGGAETSVVDNFPVGRMPVATKTDYGFLGWFTELEGGVEVTRETIVTSNLDLYAHWVERPVPAEGRTVTFDANGGQFDDSSATKAVEVTAENPLDAMPTPTRQGYLFAGWARARNGTRYWNGVESLTVDGVETMTVYAIWLVPGACAIVFDPGVKGAQWSMGYQHVGAGKVAKLNPCAFSPPSGKKFAGWRRSDNGRRYDDGVMVFNLAEPGEMVVMEATWD